MAKCCVQQYVVHFLNKMHNLVNSVFIVTKSPTGLGIYDYVLLYCYCYWYYTCHLNK